MFLCDVFPSCTKATASLSYFNGDNLYSISVTLGDRRAVLEIRPTASHCTCTRPRTKTRTTDTHGRPKQCISNKLSVAHSSHFVILIYTHNNVFAVVAKHGCKASQLRSYCKHATQYLTNIVFVRLRQRVVKMNIV